MLGAPLSRDVTSGTLESGRAPRIGVLYPSGWGNLGDEAILQATFGSIRNRWPDAAVRAFTLHPARNAAASPLRYEIDGMEQYRIQSAIEDAGHDLGAIYHSHTRSAPLPSQTDINLAFYPDALYIIVGVAGEEADVRAWRIADGSVEEAGLEIEEG